MVERRFKKRAVIIGLVIVLLFMLLAGQSANLQLVQGAEYKEKSETVTRTDLTLKGERGIILDANGIPLAYNEASYEVRFYRDPSRRNEAGNIAYSRAIYETIQIIESGGGKTQDTFVIRKDETGAFVFYWGDVSEDVQKTRLESWRKNMFIKDSVIQANEVYVYLRERYRIDENVSDDMALKMLAVWQEAQLSSYRAYKPVIVASSVTFSTVMQIEIHALELDGITTAETTKRVYPMGSSASHVLGYIGRMQDEKVIESNREKGYTRDDLIGLSGIETTMEEYLTGNSKERQGVRTVELNNRGKVTRELAVRAPTDGQNVVLTLDITLQKKLEEALESNVKLIRSEQEKKLADNAAAGDPEKYIEKMNKRSDPTIKMAEMGAAIVMDVKTGKVLALANYPSYDNNAFIQGITNAQYKALDEDPGKPLFNKAIGSRGIPGSIFKMVTTTASLMEGVVTENEPIDDMGEYNRYIKEGSKAHGPTCWVYPNITQHKGLTTMTALRDSCNYYFYEISARMGIVNLSRWAIEYGLTNKTGIELPGESTSMMANQQTLYDVEKPINQQSTGVASLTRASIKRYINSVTKRTMSVEYNDDTLDPAVQHMMEFHVTTEGRGLNGLSTEGKVIEVLAQEVEIPRSVILENSMPHEIAALLSGILWNGNMTIRAGIGQSLQMLTPIAVCRYVAALVNGGKLYEAQIVDRIVDNNGEVVLQKEPKLLNSIPVDPHVLDLIQQGMHQVISPEDRGTASKYFVGYEYIDKIAGKTGTAQTTDDYIDVENNAWFVAFAPREDPEIAMVVYVPNGLSGGLASITARDFLQYYLDRKYKPAADSVPVPNTLIQ